MNKITRRTFTQKLGAVSMALTAPSLSFSKPIVYDSQIRVRGLLMHMSHYDPKWNANKEYEQPFSAEVGMEVLEAMKKAGLNTVVLDIEDGVLYQSHPELKRHYSVPMADLKAFAAKAHELDIDFVPKLNFSKSGRNQHDKWMYPYWDLRNFVAREDEYFQVALELIDEIILECRPNRYFHIGMDEDHHRSVEQYARTIKFFYDHLQNKALKTVIWSDTAYENRNVIAQVHADKSRAAEQLIPKDIVQVLWDYDLVHKGIIKRLTDQGFEVWMAPGKDKKMIREWKKVVIEEKGSGLLLSNWIKCSEENRDTILSHVKEFGPEYS